MHAVPDASFDVALSGLVLNFVPEPERGLAEMRRAVRPGGQVAAYVWDYSEGMQQLRCFWAAATALRPADPHHDEAVRFPMCGPEPLAALFASAGLERVETAALDTVARFADFDAYWPPFLGGNFPAPAYTMSLSEEDRAALWERLRATLPMRPHGSIELTARAGAVRGVA